MKGKVYYYSEYLLRNHLKRCFKLKLIILVQRTNIVERIVEKFARIRVKITNYRHLYYTVYFFNSFVIVENKIEIYSKLF